MPSKPRETNVADNNGPAFPFELYDIIFGALANDYNSILPHYNPEVMFILDPVKKAYYQRSLTARSTLYNCSLVSRNFATAVRPHLWVSVVLRYTRRPEDHFSPPSRYLNPGMMHRMVEQTPEILHWVRHITLKIEDRHLHNYPGNRRTYPVPSFTNLESIRISASTTRRPARLQWSEVKDTFKLSLWDLLHIPYLRVFDADLRDMAGFPMHYLVRPQTITHLKLPHDGPYNSSNDAAPSTSNERSVPALGSLEAAQWLADAESLRLTALTMRNAKGNLAIMVRPSGKPILQSRCLRHLDLTWHAFTEHNYKPFVQFAECLSLTSLKVTFPEGKFRICLKD